MEGAVAEFAPGSKAAVFGQTWVLFFQRPEGFAGSAGSTIDHVGWSFSDLDAKMKGFEAAGIKILAPARQLGPIKFGFIEDPWGTKIEVMQDPELLGFHHVHLHATDPEAMLQWYVDAFGGEITRYGGFLPAVRYGPMWLIAQRQTEEKAATQGRSIDHIGFSFPDLDAAAETLKAQGVTFTMEPRPFRDLRIAFIEGPSGVRIELVQPAAP